jgi:hypothetical protein
MGDRVKTGEARKSDQPFNIDRLPDEVKEAIQDLRRLNGRTWIQIEEQSALPFKPDWRTKGGGFVNWHDLPLSVLELFPDMRIPKSSLHRWYDVRIKQAQEAVMERAEQARILAESFAGSESDENRTAALNAAADIFFGLMSEDTSVVARMGAAKGLLKLAEVQQKARTNDIRERKVSVEEQVLQIKLDEIKRKTAALIKTADGDPDSGAPQLTREQVLQQVKEIYGIA